GYQPLMYVVSFFVLPQVWEAGRKYRLQSQADFFEVRYGSKYLAAFVALIGVVCLLPYAQLQLKGLGLIVQVASYGAIRPTTAMIVAFALVASFVFVSGVRGVAWASVIKDILLLFAAVFIGIAIPHIHFGGIGPMFAAIAHAKPEHLVMPGATKNLGHAWYVSSVLMTALGFFMWPQNFAASFTARSGKILRRNAIFMPLYSITMPFMIFVGFTALLILPKLSNGDLALLTIVRNTFPAWFLGIIGGAGTLTAMVPAAITNPHRRYFIFEKYLSPSAGSSHDRHARGDSCQNDGFGAYVRGALSRHSQLGEPGFSSTDGLCRGSAILSRSRSRALHKKGQRDRNL